MAKKVATGRSHNPGKSATIFVNFLLHPVVIKIMMNDNIMFGMNSNNNIGNSSVKYSMSLVSIVSTPIFPIDTVTLIIIAMKNPFVKIEVIIPRKHEIKRHVNSPLNIGQGPTKRTLVTPSEDVRIDIAYET